MFSKTTHCFLFALMIAHSALTQSCNKEYSCMSCSQVRICKNTDNGLQEAFRFACTGDTPYCEEDSGSCTATPTSDCADTGKLTCIRDGVYPDLTGCHEYHVCRDGISSTFRCLSGQIFDGRACSVGASCQTFNCTGKTGIKVPHPRNPSMFAYCLHGKPLFVDRCPDNQRLYVDSQQCLKNMNPGTIEKEMPTTHLSVTRETPWTSDWSTHDYYY